MDETKKQVIIDEVKMIENQYKITALQLEAVKIVMKEFPECKKLLKYVLLEMAGVSEKLIHHEIKAEKIRKANQEQKDNEEEEKEDEEEREAEQIVDSDDDDEEDE